MPSRLRPPDSGAPRAAPPSGGTPRTLLRPVLAALLGAAMLATAVPAAAQTEPDAATRRAARQLAEEGGEFVDAGRYAEGVDRLSRAYALVPAPTIKLLEGHAREKLGQLVEAAEAYEVVVRTELDVNAPQAFRDAVREAGVALERIRPRIPQLTVVVDGVDPEQPGVEVTVGGALLPPPLIGQKRPVNPGRCEVVLKIDGEVRTRRDVQLTERENEQVILTLISADQRDPAPAPPPERDAPPRSRAAHRGSAMRGAAWTALGMGGAGLAVGIGAGLVMLDRKQTLDDQCDKDENGAPVYCANNQSDLDDFRTARTVSWIGWGVGITGVAAGAALLILPNLGRERAALELRVAPGQVSVSGRF